MHPLKKSVGIAARGIAMGAADVVPGVSGGTIAFITGIYEELIRSIRSINFHAFKLILHGKFRSFWAYINGSFLAALLFGILLSILSLSRLILYLLETYPILIWSFFFGLIAASALVIGLTIKRWNVSTLLALLIGGIIAFLITELTPAETPEAGWFVFLCGALAICAMILPGISGSFILLLLGKYEYILNALKEMNIGVILLFASGCIVGLLSFSHLLAWMFRHYKELTIALLTGFMIGSLNKVWPWKIPDEVRIIKGEEKIITENNLMPAAFTEQTGEPHQFLLALLLCVAGFLLIWLLEKIAKSREPEVK